MRKDMVNNRYGDDLSLCLAESAQRMLLLEKGASLTPAGILPTALTLPCSLSLLYSM